MNMNDMVVISVDDHICEPPTLFDKHLTGEALATAPEKINQDAHCSWIIRIEANDPAEANGLLSAADYEKFISEEQGQK